MAIPSNRSESSPNSCSADDDGGDTVHGGDHLLFCAEEANFQTRSMLVPAGPFLATSRGRWMVETLRRHGTRDPDHGGHVVHFDVHYMGLGEEKRERTETPDERDLQQVVHAVIVYADAKLHLDDKGYGVLHAEDEAWVPGIKCDPVSKGFDHRANFARGLRLRHFKRKPVNIIEGFLCLENRLE